jgi:hypothetical protein
LTADRIELLEKLDFSWDPYCDDWDRNYAQLSEFHAKHGHTRVPRSRGHFCAWVDRQRHIVKRVLQQQQHEPNEDGDVLNIDDIEDSDWQGGDDLNQKVVKRIALLKKLMFDGDRFEETWRDYYVRLCRYKSRFGHVVVERGQQEYQDIYHWIQRQRKGYTIGVLSKDRIEALEAIGFVWDGSQAKWYRSYATLCKFQAEHGHCRVTESETSLINWVKQQRVRFQRVVHAKNQLDSLDSASRNQFLALQKIGFEWSVE